MGFKPKAVVSLGFVHSGAGGMLKNLPKSSAKHQNILNQRRYIDILWPSRFEFIIIFFLFSQNPIFRCEKPEHDILERQKNNLRFI